MILTLSIPLIAVVIGALIAAFTTKNSVKFKQLLLSFSGSFLLSITLIELIPEVLAAHTDQKTASLFILFGILLQIILEGFSKGAEHGHSHGSEAKGIKVIALILIALFIHAFIDGVPLEGRTHLLWAVALHKIPIGMILFSLTQKAGLDKSGSYITVILFGLVTPLGSRAGELACIVRYLPYLNAISAGIFLHVGAIILFESEKGHRFNLSKIMVVILGIAIAYLL